MATHPHPSTHPAVHRHTRIQTPNCTHTLSCIQTHVAVAKDSVPCRPVCISVAVSVCLLIYLHMHVKLESASSDPWYLFLGCVCLTIVAFMSLLQFQQGKAGIPWVPRGDCALPSQSLSHSRCPGSVCGMSKSTSPRLRNLTLSRDNREPRKHGMGARNPPACLSLSLECSSFTSQFRCPLLQEALPAHSGDD